MNDAAAGRANMFNPLEHPWNFDSATVAKHRVRAITRADREACGDGKWVRVPRRLPLLGPQTLMVTADSGGVHAYLNGRAASAFEVARYFKPRCRWEIRR